ncbi:MAG: SpoIIE family protein phosphatase [Sphaerochaetaceae bacterium]|nr:SpoIIE family protein phosphatase [Sphaerochaetaceae bacterium]
MKENKEKKTVSIRHLIGTTVLQVVFFMALSALVLGYISFIVGALEDSAAVIRDVSAMASSELNEKDVMFLSSEVEKINADIPAFNFEKEEAWFKYKDRFSHLTKTEEYKNVRSLLEKYNRNSELVSSVFLVNYDEKNSRIVYLADGYWGEEVPCFPGTMDTVSPAEFRTLVLTENTSAKLERTGGIVWIYGYMPVKDSQGNVICYMGIDMSVERIKGVLIEYTIQVVLAMAAVIIITMIIGSRKVRKNTEAIIKLTSSAEDFLSYGKNLSSSEELNKTRFFENNDGGNIYEFHRLVDALKSLEQGLGDYINRVTEMNVEAEKSRSDLRLANTIQSNAVPNAFPPFPDRKEFDIYADMLTAKEVGGDFYDFFFIDNDHLGLVIADVSGKGFPAALFMMESKIIIAERAKLGGTPGEILSDANRQLCRSNAAEMFVTAWLGILEISTGKMLCSNAGHEYPMVRRSNGLFEMIKDRHGFVLGGFESSKYSTYEINLESGEAIYVYTDGITEANNNEKELFGRNRILESLNSCRSEKPEDYINTVSQAVAVFADGAPQFDDQTQMCLIYRGPETKTLTVEADKSRLDEVIAFINNEIEASGSGEKAERQLDMAVEELFVNICSYAYRNGEKGSVKISCSVKDGMATVVLEDNGEAFNPLSKDDPDISLSAEEREIGGLGIFMVKKTMDDFSYEYADGKNRVTLKKNIRK